MTGSNKIKKKKVKIDHIKCVWGLLCSLSSIDQKTNNISLFNIIEQLNLPLAYFEQQKKEKRSLILPMPYEVILYWRRTLNTDIQSKEIAIDLKLKTLVLTGGFYKR